MFFEPVVLEIPRVPLVLALHRARIEASRNQAVIAFALPVGPAPSVELIDVTGRRLERQVSVAGSVSDETPVTVTINGGSELHPTSTFSQNFSMASDGNYTITVHAANSACLSVDSVRHVARDNLPPSLTMNRPGVPFAAIDSTYLTVSGSWADTIMTYITVDGDVLTPVSARHFWVDTHPGAEGPSSDWGWPGPRVSSTIA